MKQRIKLDNGWVVEIDRSPHSTAPSYTIEKIFALFGHGVYFALDLTDLNQEQWAIFHERMKEAGA